ncbi:hypothetical protein [Nocardioides sp. TF02-7]|uniref:hypothetical protein n=1 Tax=Nocardioides sp. TF02-7 TaxID=2917724 RepID=UPI001F057341|nr:hypothetical protein [Nocardioides sp. TF02-7]UMG92477.1 hypothetical protein MF408_22000 [Nocardioides sp. TF02-7]
MSTAPSAGVTTRCVGRGVAGDVERRVDGFPYVVDLVLADEGDRRAAEAAAGEPRAEGALAEGRLDGEVELGRRDGEVAAQ